MKPWAATCAVGSELGLLSAFHESWEPVNLAGKALGLTFTVAVTGRHSSPQPACRATAGHSLFFIL